MLAKAVSIVKQSLYSVICNSVTNQDDNGKTVSVNVGSAIMVKENICLTIASILHENQDLNKNPFKTIHLFPYDIAASSSEGKILEMDLKKDLALIEIEPKANIQIPKFHLDIIDDGTTVGSISTPYLKIKKEHPNTQLQLDSRFHGGYISDSGVNSNYTKGSYETDFELPRFSIGCPGFTKDAHIFGLLSKSKIEKNTSSTWITSIEIVNFLKENKLYPLNP